MTTMTAPVTAPMTADELLAMPDDPRVVRELYQGVLRERRMTKRSYSHSTSQSMVTYRLIEWLKTQPEPRGKVIGGEAAVRITKDPDTFVGVDVALISSELAAATPKDASYVDGLPILIVEVLSPSDRHRQVMRKVDAYTNAGVPVVWVMDHDLELVTVIEPGNPAQAFNITQNVPSQPLMPGLGASVKDLFA